MADELLELELEGQYGAVAGMDEVGRGCLAGPVCVGLVISGGCETPVPEGITDSKLLTAKKRTHLEPLILGWARASTVGWAGPEEIDQWGLTEALRLAGTRAIVAASKILRKIEGSDIGVILLDGKHNWLEAHEPTLLDVERQLPHSLLPPVVTKVKADLENTCVAAASIIAKVARDRYMEQLSDPGYDWASNKGYGSVRHREALVRLGPSPIHRRSWNLPRKA